MAEAWRDLGGGLVLRSVLDERDVEQYAALHARYVSAAEGITCEKLMQAYPGASYDDYLVVEDRATGQIVATTCLIPWSFDFDGIPLQAAMLEMVVTHPDYRGAAWCERRWSVSTSWQRSAASISALLRASRTTIVSSATLTPLTIAPTTPCPQRPSRRGPIPGRSLPLPPGNPGRRAGSRDLYHQAVARPFPRRTG